MPRKGGDFERMVCRQLSLWWTDGERDDCLWRTASSGGRATIRRKSGRLTANQCGDVCATDHAAIPLLKFVTIELKRGYSGRGYTTSVNDWMDKSPSHRAQTLEEWVAQAVGSHEAAGSLSWLLVHKRDKREALAYFPLAQAMLFGMAASWPRPSATVRLTGYPPLCVTTLDRWLGWTEPGRVRQLVKEHSRGKR